MRKLAEYHGSNLSIRVAVDDKVLPLDHSADTPVSAGTVLILMVGAQGVALSQ
jgi:hypothetical protein